MAKKKKKKRVVKIDALKIPVSLKEIDYKNVSLLKKFMNRRFRLHPRSVTSLTAKKQRKLTAEVKKSRIMGMLPYTDMHALGRE